MCFLTKKYLRGTIRYFCVLIGLSKRNNQQYPPVTINTCQHNHDRFFIIDDVVYLFGASLKDAGKKLFAYIRMQETPATEILNLIR